MSDALWRFDWAPSTGEWQALWGFFGVVATVLLLVVARQQLRGLAESNKRLAESNDLLAESNRAASRPVVVVSLQLQTTPSRDFNNTAASSVIFVVIENIGQTAAREITLAATPPFETAAEEIHQDVNKFLRERFSGMAPIRMLTPGQKLKYILDTSKAALGNASLPREYEVAASYTDISGTETIREVFTLDLASWKMSIAEDAPMTRISKDIQFLSQTVEKVGKLLSKP